MGANEIMLTVYRENAGRFESKERPFVYCVTESAILGDIITIIIIIFINCNWVVTRWQWLFYMYTKHEIGYY